MTKQLDLFESQKLRDKGIKNAVDHANESSQDWSNTAYQFLLKYIANNKRFMIEEVRAASDGIVEEPPSKRAWGGIVVRARKAGLITRIGFDNVKNPLAHRTPATVWETI